MMKPFYSDKKEIYFTWWDYISTILEKEKALVSKTKKISLFASSANEPMTDIKTLKFYSRYEICMKCKRSWSNNPNYKRLYKKCRCKIPSILLP